MSFVARRRDRPSEVPRTRGLGVLSVRAPKVYRAHPSLYGFLRAGFTWATAPAAGVYASVGFGDPKVDKHYIAIVIDGANFRVDWRDEWGTDSRALTWNPDYAVSEHDYWILWTSDGFCLFIDEELREWVYAGRNPQTTCSIVVRNDSPEGSVLRVSSIVVSDIETIELKKRDQRLLYKASLAGGASSTLDECSNLDLRYVKETLAITTLCIYDAAATAGIRVHVRSSVDAGSYDTDDYTTIDQPFRAGQTVMYTVAVTPDPRHMKVLVENLDPAHAVTEVTVWGVVGT